jgi:general stress protein CsbA
MGLHFLPLGTWGKATRDKEYGMHLTVVLANRLHAGRHEGQDVRNVVVSLGVVCLVVGFVVAVKSDCSARSWKTECFIL